MVIRELHLEQSATETYTSNAGLALVGQCIKLSLLDSMPFEKQQRSGICHSDILTSYLTLASLGKSDFEAIENYRNDTYFKATMGLADVPSSSTLRQRMDDQADNYRDVIDTAMMNFMVKAGLPVTATSTGHVVVDLDVFPMDNSKTHKEGVSLTYKGHDGYAPLAAYLGNEGWCLTCCQHQLKTEPLHQLKSEPLLTRLF